MGYYVVFLGLEYHNDVSVLNQLDSDNYGAGQTVTLKVAVSIPYQINDSEFKRVDGKFEHGGEVYRLVKKKYSNDTLTVVCLKDFTGKRINEALELYVNTFIDEASDQTGESTIPISFAKEYLAEQLSLTTITTGWTSALVTSTHSKNFVATFTTSVIHPPERG
jgi:hypothetical protein